MNSDDSAKSLKLIRSHNLQAPQITLFSPRGLLLTENHSLIVYSKWCFIWTRCCTCSVSVNVSYQIQHKSCSVVMCFVRLGHHNG